MSGDLRLTDAKTLAAGVRRGEIGPALELARRVQPVSVEDLLRRAAPSEAISVPCFDACADAFAAYSHMRGKRELASA